MNREIKFRAWIPDEDSLNEETGRYDKWSMTYDLAFDEYEPINDLLAGVEHLMQYTGIKDKNGKEIWEGDILATSNDDPEYDLWSKTDHGYTVVIWNLEMDGWTGSKWVWDKNEDSVYDLRFCEVIGNIYENPDLVK